MLRVARLVVSLGVGLAMACGGSTVGTDDDGDVPTGGKPGSPAPPTGNPPKQCEVYASAWCEKSFGCFVKNGRLQQSALKYNVDQCKKLIIEKLPCSAVTSVSPTYDKCLADVKALSCASFNVAPEQFTSLPQPASCDEVVSF